MEKRRVVITGLGTVNPLGNTAAESWAAAKAGKCGIGPITQFEPTGFKCKLAGEVKNFDPEMVVDKKEARKMARFTLLALAAAGEAIADSGLDTKTEGGSIGCILSSGIGGLPTIEEQHTRGEEKGMEKVSPYFVPMSIANMAAAQVAIRFGLKGMCTCPVTACAGGTNAVGDAFHRIRDGYEPVMVCGGAESCISPLGIGGFTSMKALSEQAENEAREREEAINNLSEEDRRALELGRKMLKAEVGTADTSEKKVHYRRKPLKIYLALAAVIVCVLAMGITSM